MPLAAAKTHKFTIYQRTGIQTTDYQCPNTTSGDITLQGLIMLRLSTAQMTFYTDFGWWRPRALLNIFLSFFTTSNRLLRVSFLAHSFYFLYIIKSVLAFTKTRFKQFTVLLSLLLSPRSLYYWVLFVRHPLYDYVPRCRCRPQKAPAAAEEEPANLPTFIILCKSRY